MNWLVQKAYAVDNASGTSFDWLKPVTTGGITSLTGLFAKVVTWILIVAAGLAVIYLIYSGILYITAGGNPDSAKKGQQGVINAIIGIVIIMLAYSIITIAMNFASGTV